MMESLENTTFQPHATILTAVPVRVKIKLHDHGPALWPERFPETRLKQIEKTLGGYYFSALYQGSPSPESGGYFKRSWFKYYDRFQDGDDEFYRLEDGRGFHRRHLRRFATVDLAFSLKTSADRTCIGAWGVSPDCDLLLLDIIRDRMSGDQLIPAIKSMVSKWDLDYTGIEDVQAQTLVVQSARKGGLAVRALKANMDKLTRSIPAQIRMEAGGIHFMKSHQHLEALEHELLTFPQGASDDLLDITAYAALEVQRLGGAALSPEERERIDRERRAVEWGEKLERQKAAHENFDLERWWVSGTPNPDHDESRFWH